MAQYVINLSAVEIFVQLIILANCIVLALEVHEPEGDKSLRNKQLEKAELYFLTIFTIEAVVKIIALGFVLNKNTYLRNPWNVLDFLVILVGIIGSTFNNFDQRVVGALRALRPLKLIYNIKSLQIVIKALFQAMQPLLQIGILIMFVVLMFSIIGLEFYSGKFHFGCFNLNNNFQSNEPSVKRPCSPNNNTYNAYKCPETMICRTYWPGPFQGVINFDNIFYSMLTVFQCLTMEGWTDVLYNTNFATGTPWNSFYYVGLVLVGSFFMLNLILGVLSGEFAKERERVEKRQTFIKIRQNKIMQIELEGYLDWIETYEEILLNKEDLPDAQRHQIFKAKKRAEKLRRNKSNSERFDYLGQINFEKDFKNVTKKGFCCPCSVKIAYFSFITKLRLSCRKLFKSQGFFWLIIVILTLNILIVSLEHYNAPKYFEEFQDAVEYVFLGIFLFEMMLKIFALGFKKYFQSNFNIFDCIIVIASLFEVIWQYFKQNDSFGISALRTIRILMVFKVTRYWSSMRDLVISLLNSMRSIFSLLFLLFLFIFIFAILGMQLFGGRYNFDDGKPRQNFDTFFIGILSVFQILTCENWNDAMYNGIKAQEEKSNNWHMLYAFYFILIVVIGNYTLLNIFLAIAVDNLGNAQEREELFMDMSDIKSNNNKTDFKDFLGRDDSEVPPLKIITEIEEEGVDKFKFKSIMDEVESTYGAFKIASVLPEKKYGKPQNPYSSLYIFSPKGFLRRICHFIVNLKHFETFIVILLIASSLALANEDVINENAKINYYFLNLDYIFTGIFAIECLLKIIDMGLVFHPNSYLRSIWNIIDLFVVISAGFYIYILTTDKQDKSSIKSLRVIRVLRPLKTVQRIPKLKEVFDTVIQSIKNVSNILIVYALFQFIFSVIAVQLFSGQFFYCNDISKLTWDKCKGYFIDYEDRIPVVKSREWKLHCFHFNNVIYAFVTLYTVTTTEGWLLVLQNSMDSTFINMGPIKNYRAEMAIFYIIYFIVFPFFFVNIFVALIIITFQEEGEKSFADLGLDKNQKLCIDFAVTATPRPRFVPKTQSSLRYRIWRLVISTPFELFILIMIMCNTIVLMMRYYQRDIDFSRDISESVFQSRIQYNNYHEALSYLNYMFIFLFTIECLLKIIALNPKNYFMDFWNVFDFITVVGSITDVLITTVKVEGFIRVVPNIGFLRLFRTARIVKLLRQISGIRIILWTFIQSFKSLPYVILFIFMLFFIYCVIGMQLFGDIQLDPESQIHIYNNFQSFSQGMLLLFRCATGENWQEIMIACEEGQKCECSGSNCVPRNNCGNDIAYFYFMTFSFITTFLMFNIFIAVLMENFDYLTRDLSILGPHHLDEFIEKWSNYDSSAKGEIDYTDVYDLLINMEPPLGFGKNCPYSVAYRKLIRMNMPVKEGKVNFTTTLMALINEALHIRNGNLDQPDIQDMELRWCISKLYPKLSKDRIKLLVPTEQEMCYPTLTIGKIYTCLRIVENWRAFRAATNGRRVQIRIQTTKYQIPYFSRIRPASLTNREASFNAKPVIKRRAIDTEGNEGTKIAYTMFQNLAFRFGHKDRQVPQPVYADFLRPHQNVVDNVHVQNDHQSVSNRLISIVSDICKIYNLKIDENLVGTSK